MIKKPQLILLTLYSLAFPALYAQEYKTVTYSSYRKAKDIFDKCVDANHYDDIDSLSFTLSGAWSYLGHYSAPEKRKVIKTTATIAVRNNKMITLRGEALLSGKPYNKRVYYADDSLSLQGYGESKPTKNFSTIRKRDDLMLLSPMTLANDVLRNINTLRYLRYSRQDTCSILTYSSFLGKQVALYIKDNDFTISKSEVLRYNNIEGDYIAEYLYQNYHAVKGFSLPSKLVVKKWGIVEKELRYTYNSVFDEKTKPCVAYQLKKIDRRLYALDLPTRQHRVFVLDFGHLLGVVEAPIGNRYAECIYRVLQDHFPEKKVKYLFLTHHHPDHAGGFGYFFKEGATVITTAMSARYFNKLLFRKHTINGGSFIKPPTRGHFETVPAQGMKKIGSKGLLAYAYEFGKESIHTDEYLLVYLPQLKSLIIGDLWFVPNKGVYGSQRAENIHTFIKEHRLKVEKIYQTWPLANVKETASLDELEKSALLSQRK